MTTITIDDSTNDGLLLLAQLKGHKSVTIVESNRTEITFDEAVAACHGVDSRAFFAETRRRINAQYDRLENA